MRLSCNRIEYRISRYKLEGTVITVNQILLLHSRNILILGNSKRAFNMSTIELKLNFARQQFAEVRIKVIAY